MMDEQRLAEMVDQIYHAVAPILDDKPLSEALAATAAAFWAVLDSPLDDGSETAKRLRADIARLYANKVDPTLMDAVRAHFDVKQDMDNLDAMTGADTRLYIAAGLMPEP